MFAVYNDCRVHPRQVGAGVLLEARDVRQSYGRRQVLRGVDLAAGPGQLVAVAGENGAGKSTAEDLGRRADTGSGWMPSR
jgi:ABC-type molybdenum transport system ATPase subunit/photorepair protein PhrA